MDGSTVVRFGDQLPKIGKIHAAHQKMEHRPKVLMWWILPFSQGALSSAPCMSTKALPPNAGASKPPPVTHLATLYVTALRKTRKVSVEHWGDYGFIIPGEITTKGNGRACAEYLSRMINPEEQARIRHSIADFAARIEWTDGLARSSYDEILAHFQDVDPRRARVW